MTLKELLPHHDLFLKAYHHNWDRGTSALKRILNDKDCDRGTAQLVYWMGSPEFYNSFDEGEIPSHALKVFELLKFIEEHIGRYPSKIALDPTADFHFSVPEDLGRIPPELAIPTIGPMQATDLVAGRYGRMLLVHAAREGNIQPLREAIAEGFDVDKKIGREFLLVAASIYGHSDIIDLLAKHGANLKRKTGPSGFTALHWASQAKREGAIETLLTLGVPIDIRAKWKRTALHNAVYWPPEDWATAGMEDHVAFLLSKGADPLAMDADKKTALDLAEAARNEPALARLRDRIG